MTTVVDFDAARHRYTVAGQEMVSVTSVLADVGLIDPRYYTDAAAMRGTYVHSALALLHEDDLDLSSLDPVAIPFIDAYQRFQRESGFERVAWEQRVCDPVLRCAGTLDLLGRLPGNAVSTSSLDLLDIKTGAVPSWVGYQTAGYAQLLGQPVRRWCLQLSGDGTYRLHPLTGRRDREVFFGALTVVQAKRGWL